MSRSRSLGRMAAVPCLVAVIAGTAVAWSPAVVAAGIIEQPQAMRFSGQAGCNALVGDACRPFEHESPPGAVDWTKTDSKSVPGAAAMRAGGNVSFVEEWDGNGEFRSVTVMAHVETSVNGFGDARAQFDYELFLNDPAITELEITGIVTLAGTGSEYTGAFGNAQVEVHCDEEYQAEAELGAGLGNGNSQTDSESLGGRIDVGDDDCRIQVDGNVSTGTVRDEPGQSGRTTLDVAVTVAAAGGPQPCSGIHGTVFDGLAPVGHHNPLSGIAVQLYRNGAAVGDAVATGDDGTYCVPGGDGVEPGEYLARATLVDARHDPPLFDTRIHGIDSPIYAEVPVTAAHFAAGGEAGPAVEIAFENNALNPYHADVANIHWQSTRFVDWLLTVGLTPEMIGQFTIVTFDSSSTSSFYDRVTTPPSVHIAMAPPGGQGPGKSTFAARDEPFDNGPENAEWHEIGHHIGARLGIADIYGAPCAGRVPHGGWANATTCDSVGEGFAEWIATAASVRIDAGRGGGYGTTFYAMHGDIEISARRPWQVWTTSAGEPNGNEDSALASLLWDLADDTPGESGLLIRAKDAGAPNDGSGLFDVPARDRIGIGVEAILRILGERRPQTVVELFEALKADSALPPDANTRDLDLDGDGDGDASPLEEAFLMHGFHPVHDLTFPRFVLGDHVGWTDRVTEASSELVSRPETETIPGSWLRLQNGTDADETFTIDAAFPGGVVTRSVVVAAHSTRLEYVELPPYYPGVLAPGAALPACGGEGQEPVALTIAAASGAAEPQRLDSCAYWHAIVASTDGAAVTYTVGSGPFGSEGEASAGASPGPASPTSGPGDSGPVTIVLVGLGAVGALLVALFLVRRRRPVA